MGLYDINGNDLAWTVNVTDAQVKNAVIEGIVSGEIELPSTSGGGTLSLGNLSDAWQANASTAYASMLAEMESLGNDAVPFFIQTDQHGRDVTPARWMHNTDHRVKILILGDIVTDYFNEGQLDAFYQSIKPVDNKICVVGNHDIWTKSTEECNYYDLSKWFPSDERRMVGKHGYFTVKDNEFNVKYIVVSPYYINLETGNNGADITVKTEQMTWLLNELGANDGYDIVMLMHQLWTDTHYHRDGTLQSWADAPVVLENLWNVLKDRRNKRSGTITDGEGAEHNYDFTGCTSHILCSLHGHAHEELMLSEECMTSYVADWYGNDNSCVIGIIDRENSKLKIWKFGASSVSDVLELTI